MSEAAIQEYRKNAEECTNQAKLSIRPEHQAVWLRLADAWLQLAESLEKSGEHNPPSARGSGDRLRSGDRGLVGDVFVSTIGRESAGRRGRKGTA